MNEYIHYVRIYVMNTKNKYFKSLFLQLFSRDIALSVLIAFEYIAERFTITKMNCPFIFYRKLNYKMIFLDKTNIHPSPLEI